MNPLNDISAVYLKEVLKPQLGKESPSKKEGGAEKPSADGGEKKEGDASAGSAKRIRQAVYDIRYRARREEIPVQQAYGQYMSHTTMTGPEKSEVKAKLGEERVTEAVEEKKFQVRVTDKNSGKSYVRMATREKINQLRANSNISSVEMTKYGTPYEGEKKKGEQTAKVKSGKGLDPVGREDKDIDNDGDHDKTDKYLLNRRKVRGAAIQNKNVKEGFSNWREDLVEVVDEIKSEKKKKIAEKTVKNKITINPPLKETVENLGGRLLEVEEVQLDEVAPPSAKAERMVKHIKKGYADDGKLTKKEKSIAYATAWKQYNKEEVEVDEELRPLPKEKMDRQAQRAQGMENRAAAAGDEKETNRQMQRRLAMQMPSSRRTVLDKKKMGEEVEQIDEISAGLAGKVVNARIERTGAAADRENKARTPQNVRDTVAAADKEARARKLAAGVRKRRAANEEFEIEEGKQSFPFKKVESKMKEKRARSVWAKKGNPGPVPNTTDDEKKATTQHSKMSRTYEKELRAKQNADKSRRSPTFYKDTHPASAPKMKKKNEEVEFVGENITSTTGVTKEPTGSTKAPSKTQSTAQDAQKKQQLQQMRTMMMKKRQIQNQQLQLQKQGKLPVNGHTTEDFNLDELNRYEKETGTSSGSMNMPKGRPTKKGGETDPALRFVRQHMRKQSGKPVGQQKKEKGKKPPTAGQPGGPVSPAQKVGGRRLAAQRAQDMMHSRFD
jgi:hypothetical protein